MVSCVCPADAAQRAPNAGPPRPANATGAAPVVPLGGGAGLGAPTGPPTCHFSHIYTSGEHEIDSIAEDFRLGTEIRLS